MSKRGTIETSFLYVYTKKRHITLYASFLHKVSQTTEKGSFRFKKGLKVGSDPWNKTNLLSLGLAAKCFVNNEKERRK